MIKGKSKQLAATVNPSDATNKTVTRSSSNINVAEVNQIGLVTAKTVGSVTITATATDGSNKSATCSITVKKALPASWDSDKVTAIDDGKGNSVPIPKDFYYVGGDIDTGIVISDKQGDTIDAEGVEMGNQFVWIPANKETLTRTKFDSNGQPTTGLSASYTEPFDYDGESGYDTEAEEYTRMRTQVLTYGGFYIGRFEAGINSTILRKGATTAQKVN